MIPGSIILLVHDVSDVFLTAGRIYMDYIRRNKILEKVLMLISIIVWIQYFLNIFNIIFNLFFLIKAPDYTYTLVMLCMLDFKSAIKFIIVIIQLCKIFFIFLFFALKYLKFLIILKIFYFNIKFLYFFKGKWWSLVMLIWLVWY